MNDKTKATKQVKLDDLNKQMRILAYTTFSSNYKAVSLSICKWIIHNFKGASLIILREGKKLSIPVEHIKEGDTVCRIEKFPPELKKLTIVQPRLVEELRKRGFLGFIVVEEKELTDADKKYLESIKKADLFITKVKESIELRENASKAIETTMDEARRGKPSVDEIKGYIEEMVENTSVEAIGAIASLKQSDQTYAHCIDVGAIFYTTYLEIKKRKKEEIIFKNEQELLFGAFMHDFGKSKVPKDVLDSTVRFERDSQEMHLIRSHPVFSAELLEGMNMPDYIVNMAHYHHVKYDTSMNSSYPEQVNYNDIIYETRLLAIVDVYQALIGKRSYKKSWAPPAAIKYLDALAATEFDPEVWNDFMMVVGRYPIGSVVELSDKRIGFVMNVPQIYLDRPQVAILKDANGKKLEKHVLVDLEDNQELYISKELDQYEVFGENVLDIFTQIKLK